MIEIMGEKSICLMKGHGITVIGKTVEEATMRALNFNMLAKATLQVAQTGRKAPDISAEDLENSLISDLHLMIRGYGVTT
jgi:ribulose-5-phosphate 4-epimerase/fuculose-1-phosphate aldolase